MNITKEQYEELMGKLGNTEHVPCAMCGEGSHREVKQILLGDVLEKIEHLKDFTQGTTESRIKKTVELWRECGFHKSIQTRVEESGWRWDLSSPCNQENCPVCPKSVHQRVSDKCLHTEILMKPEANELLSHLYNLFIK